MGCDKQEGCAKKGKGDSQSAFSLDLRDDPSCDRGMLCFCEGPQDEMSKQFNDNGNTTEFQNQNWPEQNHMKSLLTNTVRYRTPCDAPYRRM